MNVGRGYAPTKQTQVGDVTPTYGGPILRCCARWMMAGQDPPYPTIPW